MRQVQISRALPLLSCLLLCLLSAATGRADPPNQAGFPAVFTDGEQVRFSSVSVGDIDGDGLPDIVVGTRDGIVQAYKSDGTKLWSFDTEGAPIEGKPAIADIDGDDSAEVIVGGGSTIGTPDDGGLYVLSHTGALQCSFTPLDHNGNTFADGIYSSPAVADLDGNDGGRLEIVFGAWDQRIRAIHDDCTLYWEYFSGDTIWSSPAIGDLDRDGEPEVVIGSDANFSPGLGLEDGGALYTFEADGTLRAGFPIQVDEVIWSSPALGDLDGDGYLDIVVGTGHCWELTSCSLGNPHEVDEAVYAWDRNGTPLAGWPVALPDHEYAFGSPALADLDGNGSLDVIVNTLSKTDGVEGQVYAISSVGTNLTGWPVQPVTPATCTTTANADTSASPIVADLEGNGDLEVILPSTWELVIWDDAGQQLSRDDACPDPPGDYTALATFSINSAAAVADLDGDNDLELIAAGGSGGPTVGAIYAWDFPGDIGELPWPQFLRAADNHSVVDDLIFLDGFDSGDTSSWNSTVSP